MVKDTSERSLTLTEVELIEVTGYRRPSRQLRALVEAGIKAWRRADGSVVVLRSLLAATAREEAATTPSSRPRLHLVGTGLKR